MLAQNLIGDLQIGQNDLVVHSEGHVVDWLADADAEELDLGVAGAGESFGLSHSTYFTGGEDPGDLEEEEFHFGTVEVALGGRFSKLKGPGGAAPEGGGTRGKIIEFSKGSRRRLLQLFNSVDRRAVDKPLFITLTYPAEYPGEGKEWKRHLDNFFKALGRKYPDYSAIWRLEFQRRGAPHFHILVFGVEFIPHDWVAETWFRIVDSGDPKHLSAGTEAVRLKSWKHAASYCSKYVAKVEQSESTCDYPGRFWGVRNRKNLPIEVLEVLLDRPEFYQLRRWVAGWMRSRGYDPILAYGRGLSAFMASSDMVRLLRFMGFEVDD